MSEARGFVRGGLHRPNHVYLVSGDGSTPDSDPEIICAFTDAWGQRVVKALNLLEEQELTAASAEGAAADDPQDPRTRARQRLIAAGVAHATELGKTIACQSPELRRHATCLGLRATINNGLGCLCPCHDGQDPQVDTDHSDGITGVVA